MKRILFLTFYFEPDLCAGSFRNTPLAYELARQGVKKAVEIDVITTLPNRYQTYSVEARKLETKDNIRITRIKLPEHKSGIKDQIFSFKTYFKEAVKLTRGRKYDLVYASSSRLFTAFLGYRIAKRQQIPLYLDIRDIFVDTIKDVFPNPLVKKLVLPVMKYIERKTFNYATHINLISGGFRDYFTKFKPGSFSEFSNGIDPEFLNSERESLPGLPGKKLIVYAGNIGEGQGLHRLIPDAADKLGESYTFRIIGDGGAKDKLTAGIGNLKNVELLPPVSRQQLIEEYRKADFLLIHLNDYEAFKKVLPSKVFELGIFPVPILAGVSGYARDFIERNLPGSMVFKPCDAEALVTYVKNYTPGSAVDRSGFIDNYRRDSINRQMAKSILDIVQ